MTRLVFRLTSIIVLIAIVTSIGGVFADWPDPGGDPPLCHHLSPAAAEQAAELLGAGRHPRHRPQAQARPLKDF